MHVLKHGSGKGRKKTLRIICSVKTVWTPAHLCLLKQDFLIDFECFCNFCHFCAFCACNHMFDFLFLHVRADICNIPQQYEMGIRWPIKWPMRRGLPIPFKTAVLHCCISKARIIEALAPNYFPSLLTFPMKCFLYILAVLFVSSLKWEEGQGGWSISDGSVGLWLVPSIQ